MTSPNDTDCSTQARSRPGSEWAPSSSLLSNLRQELALHAPFAQMGAADLDYFILHAGQQYFAPDEVLAEPAQGVVTRIYYIRRGKVSGTPELPFITIDR